MKLTPAKLSVVPVAVVLTALLVCRPPLPDLPPEPPVSAALAEAAPDVVALRLVAKLQIAREVADGRRTLWEAAALFRELNRLPPEPAKPTHVVSPVHIPVDTEEGWLCRQVVESVRVALYQEPDRAAAVVARLEAEFFAELRRRGTVRLPEASSLEPVRELLQRTRTGLTEAQRQALLGPGGASP
jgi:hypothetical protein